MSMEEINANAKLNVMSSRTTSKDTVPFPLEIVWRNVIICVCFHVAALYGLSLGFTDAKWPTLSWALCLYLIGGFGTGAGAHRLWSHRSFKAKWPLRLFIAYAQTISGQASIFEWSRNHRTHHKFSETNADPHNAKRGFFFAHMGWLMCKKHPDVIRCGKTVDISDLLQDPIVFYQNKFIVPLWLSLTFAMPTMIPWYFWEENLVTAFFVVGITRYILNLHAIWLVNSAAHMWGSRPYDKNISPTENGIVSFFICGEGWHNFHHTFPWDYRAAELGHPYAMNLSTVFIDFFAWVGLAYDLKTVSNKVVNERMRRTGDGTRHPHLHHK